MKKLLAIGILAATVLFFNANAKATPIYVGSWNVNDGTWWTYNPLAYSALGAAELLFGSGTYRISTIGPDAAYINDMAWYNVIGVGARQFAPDYFRGIPGVTHYQDVYVYDADIDTVSAYVEDFSDNYTINYAFLDDAPVPEPATMILFGMGLAGVAGLGRMKKNRRRDEVRSERVFSAE